MSHAIAWLLGLAAPLSAGLRYPSVCSGIEAATTAEDCPDRPQYKAHGNSMAVPCMAWIERRIQKHLQA